MKLTKEHVARLWNATSDRACYRADGDEVERYAELIERAQYPGSSGWPEGGEGYKDEYRRIARAVLAEAQGAMFGDFSEVTGEEMRLAYEATETLQRRALERGDVVPAWGSYVARQAEINAVLASRARQATSEPKACGDEFLYQGDCLVCCDRPRGHTGNHSGLDTAHGVRGEWANEPARAYITGILPPPREGAKAAEHCPREHGKGLEAIALRELDRPMFQKPHTAAFGIDIYDEDP